MTIFREIFNLKATQTTLLLSVFLNLVMFSFLIFTIMSSVEVPMTESIARSRANQIIKATEVDSVTIWIVDINSGKKKLIASMSKSSFDLEKFQQHLEKEKILGVSTLNLSTFSNLLGNNSRCLVSQDKNLIYSYSCVIPFFKQNDNVFGYAELMWKIEPKNINDMMKKLVISNSIIRR